MEIAPHFPAPVRELIARYLRASSLKQTVDWPEIVDCMRKWSSAMNLGAPAILRIETSWQYLNALQAAGAARRWVQERQANIEPDTWARRAIYELQSGNDSNTRENIIATSRAVRFANSAVFGDERPCYAGIAGITRRPMAIDARQDTKWLSIATIGAVESGNVAEFRKWYPLFKAFEAGALCFFLTERGIEVCPLPAYIKTDSENRLHSESGPAFSWLNDVRHYYWHGMRVEDYVVDHPERITVPGIEGERDAQVRELKIERFKAAYPNLEMPPIRTVTAGELKERYFRACELSQRVDWERIVACIRRWAMAFDIHQPRIVRVENSEQLKKTASAAWAYRISPQGRVTDAQRRAQATPHNTWAHEAMMAQNRAQGHRANYLVRQRSSGIRNVNELVEAKHWEQIAAANQKKSATSASGAADAVRTKKIAPVMAQAANLWSTWVAANGRMTGGGREAAWDITLNCICAIDALEQPRQGTKFSNWYQLFKAFEAGAFCFFVNGWTIEVCTLPSIARLDDAGRFHSDAGPAFAWLDDVRDYYWHGVRVEAYVVEDPGRITVADIERERNVEVRRVKLERFGQGRYLIESGARVVHRDDFGILLWKDFPNDEPLVMVKVVNATPEPDGTCKDYFLRVPPHMQTAREAVAWTFGKTPVNYRPTYES
jgi:hypothetical protein